MPVVAGRTQGGGVRSGADPPDRWRRVAIEAVKQSGRMRVPEIPPITALDEAVRESFAGVSLVLDPGGQAMESVLADWTR